MKTPEKVGKKSKVHEWRPERKNGENNFGKHDEEMRKTGENMCTNGEDIFCKLGENNFCKHGEINHVRMMKIINIMVIMMIMVNVGNQILRRLR